MLYCFLPAEVCVFFSSAFIRISIFFICMLSLFRAFANFFSFFSATLISFFSCLVNLVGVLRKSISNFCVVAMDEERRFAALFAFFLRGIFNNPLRTID